MILIQIQYLSLVFYFLHEVLTENVSSITNIESNITCPNSTTISIHNITINHLETSCVSGSCNLEEMQNDIIENCEGKTSCTLISNGSISCLMDPGFLTFSYQCKAKALVCDFDGNACDWEVLTSQGRYVFQKTNSLESFYLDSSVDHTTLRRAGLYFYFGAFDNAKSNIYLRSETVIPSYHQCLSFWYYLHGYGAKSLSVYQIFNNSTYIRLWTTSYGKGDKWYNMKLTLHTNNGSYRIAFKGDIDKGIAVDDIAVSNAKCEASRYDCDFESHCWWTSDYNQEYTWTRVMGKAVTRDNGPFFDRTTGSRFGQFMFLEAKDNKERSKANFSSPLITSSEEMCFSFWYHMNGEGIGSLAVYLDDKNSSSLVWEQNGNRGDRWLQAFINVSSANSSRIVIEGTRGNEDDGNIAIDDMSLSSASCSGYVRHSQTCLEVTEPIQHAHCPEAYVDFNNSEITFEPKLESCANLYEELQNNFRKQCLGSNIENCSFDILDAIQKNPHCFLLNNITVDYSCHAESPVEQSSPVLAHSESTSQVNAGIGVAVVVCVICLAVGLVFIAWKRKKAKSSGIMDTLDLDDYIGIKNICFGNSTDFEDDNKLKDIHLQISNKGSERSSQTKMQTEDLSTRIDFENWNIWDETSDNESNEEENPEPEQTRYSHNYPLDETYCNNVTALEDFNPEIDPTPDYENSYYIRKLDVIDVTADVKPSRPRRGSILKTPKTTPSVYELAKPISKESEDAYKNGMNSENAFQDEIYKNLNFSLTEDSNVYSNSAECVYHKSFHGRKHEAQNEDDYDHCVKKKVRFNIPEN